jgi:hypothetical protein
MNQLNVRAHDHVNIADRSLVIFLNGSREEIMGEMARLRSDSASAGMFVGNVAGRDAGAITELGPIAASHTADVGLRKEWAQFLSLLLVSGSNWSFGYRHGISCLLAAANEKNAAMENRETAKCWKEAEAQRKEAEAQQQEAETLRWEAADRWQKSENDRQKEAAKHEHEMLREMELMTQKITNTSIGVVTGSATGAGFGGTIGAIIGTVACPGIGTVVGTCLGALLGGGVGGASGGIVYAASSGQQ